MPAFSHLLQQGATNAWLFIPTAVVLGALHGLEPGHSKTMMAAFIVAIRGTIWQAVLLGLSAAISHSLIVWLLAAGALSFGSHWTAETTEPYLQLLSATIVGGLAVWMFLRTRTERPGWKAHADAHSHGYMDGHAAAHSHPHHHEDAHESLTGTREPTSFEASLTYADHAYGSAVLSGKTESHAYVLPQEGCQDAHERAHATAIQKRFAGQQVTTWQIILFGLTGGLLPCPAAFSILIICLQIKQFALGFGLVLAFSAGLALTLIATGCVAAWSVRHAERRFKGFSSLAQQAPYLSSTFLILVAIYLGFHAWLGITALH
jgi:nickel/cobalt transporter (NicO) family protein